MHDTETGNFQSSSLHEDARSGTAPVAGKPARKASAEADAVKPRSLLERMLQFLVRFFTRKTEPAPLKPVIRVAASRTAQMEPPVAFRGDTASTLVTPMGAYAGKPVDQATRKRAEQQFKNMDVTRTTMN